MPGRPWGGNVCNQDPLLRFDFISYSVTFGILGEQAHAGSQLPRAACCRALAAPRAPLRTVPARWALITNPARIRGYSSSATRLAKSRCAQQSRRLQNETARRDPQNGHVSSCPNHAMLAVTSDTLCGGAWNYRWNRPSKSVTDASFKPSYDHRHHLQAAPMLLRDNRKRTVLKVSAF